MSKKTADRAFGEGGWSAGDDGIIVTGVEDYEELVKYLTGEDTGEDLVLYLATIDGKPVVSISLGRDASGRNAADAGIWTVQLPETITALAADSFADSGIVQVNAPPAVIEALGQDALDAFALGSDVATKSRGVNDALVVRISPKMASAFKGTSQQFTVFDKVMGGTSTMARWSLVGEHHGDTKISALGILTVAAGETAEYITLKALSFADTGIGDTVRVAIALARDISSAADLAKIGVDSGFSRSAAYTLTADITLSDWVPLCADAAHAFSGVFDGNGHTITVQSFNAAAVSANAYVGIFGYVKGLSSTSKAAIKNLRIVSAVNADSTRNGGQAAGLAAGYAARADLADITLEGNFRFNGIIGVVYLGGVAGWIEYGTVIKDCTSSLSVHGGGGYDVPLDPNIVVYNSVGGFVGLFKHSSEIRDCHTTGNVSGGAARPSDALVASRGAAGNGSMEGATTNDPNHAQAFVGGIAGGSYFGFEAGESGGIYNCSSSGYVSAGAGGWWALAGGISGCFQGDVRMEYCTVSGAISASSQYAYVGGMTAYGASQAVFYRCAFNGIITPGTHYAKGPIAGQQGQVIECTWNTAPEPAPQATIDLGGKLIGLEGNKDYTVNGTTKRADTLGSIPLDEAWFGATVTVIKKSVNAVVPADSAPQSLAIPARPAAPTGISASGSAINGTASSMEWAPLGTAASDSAAWTACAGSSVSGLAPGSYYVRYKQAVSSFPSVSATVVLSRTINSAADMAKIGVDPAYPATGAYALGADITLSNWTPLAFAGTFDGNNHRITLAGFNSTAVAAMENVGIFSTITGPAYTMPVRVENLTITIGNNAYAGLNGFTGTGISSWVGTLAGKAQFALIVNIHVDGSDIAFNSIEDAHHTNGLGGIVGVVNGCTIRECSNSAGINAAVSMVGGITGILASVSAGAGSASGTSILEDCSASGAITSTSATTTRANVGGIAGRVSFSTVRRSSFAGTITVTRGNDWTAGSGETTSIGGIAGFMQGDTGYFIEDCHSSGVFTGLSTNTATTPGMAAGGILGQGWGTRTYVRRCYSTAELRVQRDTQAYAGGIVGLTKQAIITGIADCVALNTGIHLESTTGMYTLHRVGGGQVLCTFTLSNNSAWSAMPLFTKEGANAEQPFTEQAADKVAAGLSGADCAEKPAQSVYAAMGWDFATVWQMSGDGYPKLMWE
jgi:hypothetical protein